MSQDLFAAFGEPPTKQSEVQSDALGDDDWGDFENAGAASNTSGDVSKEQSNISLEAKSQPGVPTSHFPPKAQQREELQLSPKDARIGQHPFANHMDFLFGAGEDEYDAGFDDLDNLSTNPEAAMAYSKRIIAEQEARAIREGPTVKSHTEQQYRSQRGNKGESINHASSADTTKSARKLTKSQPQPQPLVASRPSANPAPARNKLRKKFGYAPAKDPNVLFDADNVSDSEQDDSGTFEDDSFGDFASATTIPMGKTDQPEAKPAVDLLGLETVPKSLGEIGRSRSASVRAADAILGPPKSDQAARELSGLSIVDNPWADSEEAQPQSALTVHTTFDHSAIHDDSAWGDFDDFDTPEPSKEVTAPTTSAPVHQLSSAKIHHNRNKSSTSQELALPPTNIPPPVLLLTIFPSLFSSAQENLLGPLSKLEGAQRQQLLSHPATHQFLRRFLNQAIVLAHIIAGRKLRWKRDQILTQSMRIGPSAAGGKAGMKLITIDKSEVAKEDREVLDAVRLWKAQIGKLRGAISGASGTAKLPTIPEISEQMPVKVLKAIEGGFVAPHACALCGLKREERVAKVDVDVNDSFGEWWINGTDMHLTCKTWWDENKKKLQSR